MQKENKIVIVGSGLVGSLLAVLLVKKGFNVSLYEKRNDPRVGPVQAGRSINLALSHRGIRALEMAGVFEKIKPQLIPMRGRMMHDEKSELTFQPYGTEDQFINSVSRGELNRLLIEEAEAHGVNIHFGHLCTDVNFEGTEAVFQKPKGNTSVKAELIIGTDGAFSAVRGAFEKTDRFNYSQYYIEHGYKELSMPSVNGDFAMEPNYLHIWPRHSFMLIALPNPDKTFTCTLFFPFEGPESFSSIKSDEEIVDFFRKNFPDVISKIPDFIHQFKNNPTSSLVTVRCYPWVRNQTLLLGDAAHAIVPFYGQGMNAGFEDCRLLMEMAEQKKFNWNEVLPAFQKMRKPDADGIADLALKNFVEMRDRVADDKFLLRKKLEAKLHAKFPEKWVPQYTMVTFTDTPYSEAWRIGKLQDDIMEKVLADIGTEADLETLDLAAIVGKLG
jgi:kynurenine 3-monooxygenase